MSTISPDVALDNVEKEIPNKDSQSESKKTLRNEKDNLAKNVRNRRRKEVKDRI